MASVAAGDELTELVQDRAIAPGRQHVQERLRAEDLADRRRERRRSGLLADADDLGERVEQPVAGGVRAQVDVERGDETSRQVVLGCPHRDPRRERGERLVADVLVDDVRRLPESGDVDPGRSPEPLERLDERLPAIRWSASASG